MKQLGIALFITLSIAGCSKKDAAPPAASGDGSAAGTAPAGAAPSGDDATTLKEFEGFRDKMCACTDAKCADAVTADWRTWRDGKKKPEGDLKAKVKEIDHAFHECEHKASAGGGSAAPATP